MGKVLGFTDWMGLSLTLLDDVGPAPDGHVWQMYEGGTNVWNHRRVLYNDRGDRVLTLLSKPKSGLISASSALMEVSNEWLYHGLGVKKCMDLLLKSVPYGVTGLSRLDLAMDFVPDQHQQSVIEGLASGRLYVQGKRSGSGFWSVNNDKWMPSQWVGRKIPHCLSWGHKTSSVKWKLYYKTKELRDGTGGLGYNKPYIVDVWREAGFDETNVWRLEVSIKHGNTLTWCDQTIDFNTWYHNTAALIGSFYNDRFVVRRNEGHKDKSNDEIVPFLDISSMRHVKCKTYDGTTPRSGRITLLRHLIKSLDDDEVLLDKASRDDVLAHITAIVYRDNLENYFEGMVEKPLEAWCEEIIERSQGAGHVPLERNALRVNAIQPNREFNE